MEDRKIFKVTGGKAEKVIEKALAFVEEKRTALNAFYARYGCASACGRRHAPECLIYTKGTEPADIGGIPFEKLLKLTSPTVESDVHDPVYYLPNLRTKAGKALAEEIHNLSYDIQNFASDMFKGNTDVYTPIPGRFSMMMVHPVMWNPTGEMWVVSVHKDAKCEPVDGLEEMLLSEYYLMVENDKAVQLSKLSEKCAAK